MKALPRWAALSGAVAMGAALAALLLTMHAGHMDRLAEQAARILARHPYSAVMQTRLAAPALVLAVSAGSGLDWTTAFRVVLGGAATASIVTATVALGSYTRSTSRGLAYGFAQAVAIALLQDAEWLHVWDLLDVVIGNAFAYAIFTGARPTAFLPLFVVALTNRESALFIPAWLVLSALPSRASEGGRSLDARRALIGAVALALGLLTLGLLRDWLFLGDPAPYRRVTPWGNHVTLWHNAHDLYAAVSRFELRSLSIYAALVACGAWATRATRRLPAALHGFGALLALMTGSILLLALVLETRTWLLFVPMLAFLHAATTVRGVTGTPAATSGAALPG